MARLIISDGASERPLELTDSITTFGRAPENRAVLQDKECSRRHFQIERIDVGFKLVDLESRNGTRVNDRFVNQLLLRPGDRIQIGKTTLTFQDPDWKEPPPEVAAMFGPPPSAAPVVEALPSPVRPEAPLPAPSAAPAPAPAPPPFEPRSTEMKKRSGATTSIDKIAGVQRVRAQQEKQAEQRTLKAVGVAGGLFLALILGLILLSWLTQEKPEVRTARDRYEEAFKLRKENRAEAIRRLNKITPEGKEWYTKAQQLLRELQEAASAPSEEEQAEFNQVQIYSRGNPSNYDEIVKKCDEFKSKYPSSSLGKEVNDIREFALIAKRNVKEGTWEAVNKKVEAFRTSQDFAKALQEVEKTLANFRDDPKLGPQLGELRNKLITEGKDYFQKQDKDAQSVEPTDKLKARRIYREILDKLGDGKVDVFSAQCRAAQSSLDRLGN